MMHNKDYWKTQKEHSRIKSEIVAKYFGFWANVMNKPYIKRLTYLDLCSGRGKYEDGSPSTPILIMDEVGKSKFLLKSLEMQFYEIDKKLIYHLERFIKNHPAHSEMKMKPNFYNSKVDNSLINSLKINSQTFCFIDPFGYQEISLELLKNVTKGWGCDCVFYLSTPGIERNFEKPPQEEHLRELFSNKGFEKIKSELTNKSKDFKLERLIIETLKSALLEIGINYFLNFCIYFDDKDRTSHHLIFISDHWLGFKVMKEIMVGYSSENDGIPKLCYSYKEMQQINIELNTELPKIGKMLLNDFKGMKILVGELLKECHRKGYLYIEKNIKHAIEYLEESNKVVVDIPYSKRRVVKGKVSLGDKRIVKFLN